MTESMKYAISSGLKCFYCFHTWW